MKHDDYSNYERRITDYGYEILRLNEKIDRLNKEFKERFDCQGQHYQTEILNLKNLMQKELGNINTELVKLRGDI